MSVILKIWDEEHALEFTKEQYRNNGNLAIEIIAEDKEYGGWEPWCSLTTNLTKKLPNNQAYLDTNNCSSEIIDWLFNNGYAKQIDVGFSGFCMYPLVEFSKAFMETILVEM